MGSRPLVGGCHLAWLVRGTVARIAVPAANRCSLERSSERGSLIDPPVDAACLGFLTSLMVVLMTLSLPL
jgi:hypothetical protein